MPLDASANINQYLHDPKQRMRTIRMVKPHTYPYAFLDTIIKHRIDEFNVKNYENNIKMSQYNVFIMVNVVNYSCPRCGYTSNKKQNMQTHFLRKHPCQLQDDCIELTNDIIKKVLRGKFQKTVVPIVPIVPIVDVVPVVCQPMNINNDTTTFNNNTTIIIQYIRDGKVIKQTTEIFPI